ncbi:GntR family transcriptional regulator [Pseudonocardia sp. GCM10023141]|uniref:GntR family transcriptional regulator n=1 Tax=Pseudonocardia sp. GCM10023141 TaxID=3252653 RepID=UPI00360A9C26
MRVRIERDPSALTSEVRDRLIGAMMAGDLVPGDRLILDKLAEQLGVSRTPVRDALLRLVSEGIVEPSDTRGYVIRELSAVEIEHNFDSRLAIESHAAAHLAELGEPAIAHARKVLAKAAKQPKNTALSFYEANRMVHRAIVEATGNPQLVMFFDTIWGQAGSNQIYLDFFHAQSDKTFVEDHEKLLDAIAKGDAIAARAAMIEHVNAGRNHMAERRNSDG